MEGVILDMSVSIPHYFVSHEALAEARGVAVGKYKIGLGCHSMAVCGQGEDVVTLAAEAAWKLLEKNAGSREKIGLCIVGTESGVDHSKPISSYLHSLLELPSSCRIFEIKHACYSGTAALQMARNWSLQNPDELALIVMTDIARYERHSPGESTQGGGAVALLIGHSDDDDYFLELSAKSGIHAMDVHDFWRPNYLSSALVKGKYSIQCYLDGLVAAYDDYVRRSGDNEEVDYLAFHVPFPSMARKAHNRLLKHQGIEDEEVIFEDFKERVEPALWANRIIGNIYSGSLYLMLGGLCELKGNELSDKKIALFSYGSGSCSEYFTGTFGQRIPQLGLRQLLDSRIEIDVTEYERLHDASLLAERDGSYNEELDLIPRPFVFLGVREHERIYRRNEAFFKENLESYETLSNELNAATIQLH